MGVNPDLVAVVKLAIEITKVDFMVTEGLRTKERQRQLYDEKKSMTLNSKHLTGDAVDLAPLVDGDIPWKDTAQFKKVADAMYAAAAELGVKILWGGDFRSFYDGPHFELRG